MRAKVPKEMGLPCEADIPAPTTLAEAPMRVAFPPRVPANIIATNTGSVDSGQEVNAGPSAISGTNCAATRYPFTTKIIAATTGMFARTLDAAATPASRTIATTSISVPNHTYRFRDRLCSRPVRVNASTIRNMQARKTSVFQSTSLTTASTGSTLEQ